MAFNKDIAPGQLGKNQPAPKDLFERMNQGSIKHKGQPGCLTPNMKQPGYGGKKAGRVFVGKRMKQGGKG